MAACGARATAGDAGDRVSQQASPDAFGFLVAALLDVLRYGVVVGRITQKTVDLDEHAPSRLSSRTIKT